MKQFIAISDDMFYRHPELFECLIPFTHNIDCRHLLQEPLAPQLCLPEPQVQTQKAQQDTQSEYTKEKSLCQSH